MKINQMNDQQVIEISDYDIQALVDNQVSPEHEQRIREHINNCSKSRKRYEELCEQMRLLKNWWKENKSH